MTEEGAIKEIRENMLCDYCIAGCDECDIESCSEKDAFSMAIKALKEVQQYQALEKRLSDMFGGSLSLKMCVDELERILTEPDSPHQMNAKILTYQEAADWEAYRAIGTPEECRAAVEKQKEMITYCDENDCSDCPFHNTSKKYNKCMNDFIAEEIVKGGGV